MLCAEHVSSSFWIDCPKTKLMKINFFNLFPRTFFSVEPLTSSEHNIWKYVLLKIHFEHIILCFYASIHHRLSYRFHSPFPSSLLLFMKMFRLRNFHHFFPFTVHKRNSERNEHEVQRRVKVHHKNNSRSWWRFWLMDWFLNLAHGTILDLGDFNQSPFGVKYTSPRRCPECIFYGTFRDED